jgi:hypothetical protein
MRTTLNCLFAAVVAVGCGGAKEAAAPTPVDEVAVANPVSCATASPAGTVNQPQVKLQGGRTFNIAVQVDLAGSGVTNINQLSFEWRSTDGRVVDQNSPTTTWTAPDGPGLHFVYVLVKNGKGGYTERRVAMSTEDAAGVPPKVLDPVNYAPPPSPEPNCFPFRAFTRTAEFYGFGSSNGLNRNGQFVGGDSISLPDVELFATDTVPLDPNNPPDAVRIAKTNLRGEFKLDAIPVGDFDNPNVGNKTVEARLNLGERIPLGVEISAITPEGRNDIFGQPLGAPQAITGRVVLSDGQPCGTVNEFFAKEVSGTATLLDANGQTIATRRLSDKGHYAFPSAITVGGVSIPTNAARVRLQCENSATVEVVANTTAPRVVIPNSVAPKITTMTAALQGSTANVGIFLTPFSGGESDQIADSSYFLGYKGVDNALSACMYYRSIGAVKNCGPNGELIEPISYDDWLRKQRLGQFVEAGRVSSKAKFINRVDLNLARDHEAISYKAGEAAGCVSNYLGAGGDLDAAIENDPEKARAAIDASIDGLVAGKNLVARVCMDHTATPGVNGNKPFTNFLIFGGSGELLPRINLDGRGERFVPNTCTICHGGDRTAGAFPTDGTGTPDIGTHMLPFIPPNYNFSSKVGLRRVDQERAIFDLNQIILQSGPTLAAREAIAGWYANGQTYDDNYLPDSWKNKSAADKAFYQQVYKADCLGCHINGPSRLNFDRYENLVAGDKNILTSLNLAACGGGTVPLSSSYLRNKSMPNALRTFDLIWGSQGRSVNGVSIDKPAIIARFLNQYLPDVTSCNLTVTPLR